MLQQYSFCFRPSKHVAQQVCSWWVPRRIIYTRGVPQALRADARRKHVSVLVVLKSFQLMGLQPVTERAKVIG